MVLYANWYSQNSMAITETTAITNTKTRINQKKCCSVFDGTTKLKWNHYISYLLWTDGLTEGRFALQETSIYQAKELWLWNFATVILLIRPCPLWLAFFRSLKHFLEGRRYYSLQAVKKQYTNIHRLETRRFWKRIEKLSPRWQTAIKYIL